MALTAELIRQNLVAFGEKWSLYPGSERAEAQTFINELFACYGQDRQAVGARFEEAQHGKFLNLLWPGVCLVEMKRPSEAGKLAAHRQQALDYWRHAADPERNVPAPEWVVLCAFHRFEIWQPGKYPGEPRAAFDQRGVCGCRRPANGQRHRLRLGAIRLVIRRDVVSGSGSAGCPVIVTKLSSDEPTNESSSAQQSGAAEEHPEILWLMVADHALLDTQGKLSVIGMFDRLFAGQFPSIHPVAFVVAQWRWRPLAPLGSELRLFGPSGELLVGAAQQLQTGPDGKTAHIVRLSPIPLPAAGSYTVEMLGNNRSAAHMTLTVEQVPT